MSLKKGDRVRVRIKRSITANNDILLIEDDATILGTIFLGFPLLFLDNDAKGAFIFQRKKNIDACIFLGLDPTKRRGWEINPQYVEVIKFYERKQTNLCGT
jgi:hypothetical protein